MNTHASVQSLLPLEEPPPDGRTLLNASVWFVDSDGYRVVFRWHEPLYHDTWVHDADGEPLLVVTSEVNAKLTQVLEPILANVRRLVGDQRRMTVIFDRRNPQWLRLTRRLKEARAEVARLQSELGKEDAAWNHHMTPVLC